MASQLVSPQQMLDAAKKMQLNGREPQSIQDWEEILNFVAANAYKGSEKSVVRIFCLIFKVPVPSAAADLIAEFQLSRKIAGPLEEDDLERDLRCS